MRKNFSLFWRLCLVLLVIIPLCSFAAEGEARQEAASASNSQQSASSGGNEQGSSESSGVRASSSSGSGSSEEPAAAGNSNSQQSSSSESDGQSSNSESSSQENSNSGSSQSQESTTTVAPVEQSTEAAVSQNVEVKGAIYIRGEVPETSKHTYAFCAAYVLNKRWLAALGDCFFVKAEKSKSKKNLKDKSLWQLRKGGMFDTMPPNYSCSSGSSSSFSMETRPNGAVHASGSRRINFNKNNKLPKTSDIMKNFKIPRHPVFPGTENYGAGVNYPHAGIYQPILEPPPSYAFGFYGKRSAPSDNMEDDDESDDDMHKMEKRAFDNFDKRFFRMPFNPDSIWSCTIPSQSSASNKNQNLIEKIIVKPGYTKGAFGSNLALVKLNTDLADDLIKTDSVKKPNSKLMREVKAYKTWISATMASQ